MGGENKKKWFTNLIKLAGGRGGRPNIRIGQKIWHLTGTDTWYLTTDTWQIIKRWCKWGYLKTLAKPWSALLYKHCCHSVIKWVFFQGSFSVFRTLKIPLRVPKLQQLYQSWILPGIGCICCIGCIGCIDCIGHISQSTTFPSCRQVCSCLFVRCQWIINQWREWNQDHGFAWKAKAMVKRRLNQINWHTNIQSETVSWLLPVSFLDSGAGDVAPQVCRGDQPQLALPHSPPDLGGGDAPHKQPGGLPHYPDVGQGTWPGPRPCCWWALARLGPGTAAQSKYGWPWELPRPASHPRSRRRSRRRWRRYPGPTRPGSHRYIWLNSAGRHTSCLLTQREGGRLDKCLSNRSSSRSRSRSRSWRVSPEEIISGEIIDWSGDYLWVE